MLQPRRFSYDSDTLGVAARFSEKGVPIVGIPKTIDKDLAGTDYTLGFDSALRND
jgi:6-phosphofructokinase